MAVLDSYTTEELEVELERRKCPPAPKPLSNPEWGKLIEVCEDYMAFIESDEYHEDNDYEHYIFEKALEVVYGAAVWGFIKARC